MNRELIYQFHSAFVQAWLEQNTTGLNSMQIAFLLELALIKLYSRAQTLLKHFAFQSLCERVLVNTSSRFPFFESVKLDQNHFDFTGLIKATNRIKAEQMKWAAYFTLSELLMVIGTLTSEQITADLHEELDKLKLNRRSSKFDINARV